MEKLFTAMVLLSASAAWSQRNIAFVPNNSSECCSTTFVNGVTYHSITDGDVTVTVGLVGLYDKNTFQQSVWISKSGPSSSFVDPELSTIRINNNPPIINAMDGDAFIAAKEKRARRGAMVAAMLGGFAAGASQQQAYVANSDGSSSVITYHDPQADRNAQANAAAMGENIRARFTAMSTTALRKNTIFQNSVVSGVIYFAKPKQVKIKEIHGFVSDIRVGENHYLFPSW